MPKFTPENVRELEPNQVFVFGSNFAGRHGKGAAKIAAQKFGARYGQGTGLMGQSYGIATKSANLRTLSLEEIEKQVDTFLRFAEQHKELEFLVTKFGTGLSHYKISDIAKMFTGYVLPDNITLPKEFYEYIHKDIIEKQLSAIK